MSDNHPFAKALVNNRAVGIVRGPRPIATWQPPARSTEDCSWKEYQLAVRLGLTPEEYILWEDSAAKGTSK